jgi:hypothetical protein
VGGFDLFVYEGSYPCGFARVHLAGVPPRPWRDELSLQGLLIERAWCFSYDCEACEEPLSHGFDHSLGQDVREAPKPPHIARD